MPCRTPISAYSAHMRHRLLLITTFGLGYRRPASGTWGSLPPPAIAWAMMLAGMRPAQTPYAYHGVLIGVLALFSYACVRDGDRAEARFGEKDPSNVVADETAGQTLPLMALPASAVGSAWHALLTCAAAFVLFRIFDIIKPWPARGLQRVPGGWGILLDDLFAGLYAAAIVQLSTRLLLA